MPPSYSKLFSENFKGITCTDIVHPGRTCSEWLHRCVSADLTIGILKFYFPVCLVCLTSLLVNIKRWNEIKTWTDFLKILAKCFIFGSGFGLSIFCGICLQYQLFKKFQYHAVMWLPTFIASFLSIILPPAILNAESLALFNFYIEYLIRSSNNGIVQKLKTSLVSASIIFAAFNALLMCGMLKAKCPNFWFSRFKFSKDKETTNTCQRIHANLTCSNYLIKEIKQASIFGLGFCVIKCILSSLKEFPNGPLAVMEIFLRSFDFKLFSFIAGIDGIFKTLFCFFNQKTSFTSLQNCGISSFLAGLTYAFFPCYEIFTLAISNSIATFYNTLLNSYEEKKENSPKVLEIIDKLPIYYFIFVVIVPILMHLRVFSPYHVNRTVSNFMRIGSNGKDRDIIYRAVSVFLGYKIK